MQRILTVCAFAMVAILLLSSDASAFGRRRSACDSHGYDNYGAAYGSYGTTYGSYGTTYGGYAAPYYGSVYGGSGYSGYSGYGNYGRYGYDYGRPGYNPGGLGGPGSGLGVRPGAGFGGFGPRR